MKASIAHFTLPRILPPGHTLAVHLKLFQLSHLGPGRDGPRLLRVVTLREEEVRVLMPLLAAYPRCGPYEVVLASLAAQGADDEIALARYRHRLGEAKDETLAPVRPLLKALNKQRGLRALNMRVLSLQDAGYCLGPLVEKKLSLVRPGAPADAQGASGKREQGRSAFHIVRG